MQSQNYHAMTPQTTPRRDAEEYGDQILTKAVKAGRTLTYYAGSGWSQGGVEDMKEWIEEIGQAQAAAVTPLKVTVLN